MAITDATPSDTAPRPRVVGAGVVALLLTTAAIGGFWLIARLAEIDYPHGDSQVMQYTTVQDMAEHVGCVGTLRPAQTQGDSSTAGECTYDGALVEFRIYPTSSEAFAWLEGNRSQSLNSEGIFTSFGVYGGTWVMVIHTTDPELADRAGIAVQT